jgi:general secretion pathway protein D
MKMFCLFFARRTGLIAGVVVLSLWMAGCAQLRQPPFIPPPIAKPARPDALPKGSLPAEDSGRPGGTNFYETPKPPSAPDTAGEHPPAPPVVADEDDLVATITLDDMPLPQFINVIYSAILKRNVSMDAQVSGRSDMVTFRTGKPQSAVQIFTAAQALLRSYGIAVRDYEGTLRVTPENSQAGILPEIRRGKASPEVPASLRPIFYLVELQHVQITQASAWLKSIFQGRLTVQDDAARNALLLSGQSDTVFSAMEVVQILDQPLMRGRVSARIVPIFWSADEMARRLLEVLQAEGYSAALQATSPNPILILPVGPINSIIIFAGNDGTLNHILRWARDLDQSPQGRMGNFINYQVRNTDAADLAQTLGEVMGMTSAGGSGSGTAGAGPGGGGASSTANRNKVVVNPAANSIIVQTTPAEFQQWYGLLQELDRPARNALIMATVAEVTLNENEAFGFQWLVKQFMSHGYRVNLGTVDSAATSAASGTFRIGISGSGGDPRALLTFLASADKLRILSNPSVMARNGQEATIQVGDEVPILTSQLSSGNMNTTETGTSTNILQTVQYRSTGVILNVKPVIHAGGRIDLDVSQEVSTVGAAGIGGSPTISTRRIQTRLTVLDGNTLLLGGLMREEQTEGDAGIPWFKDLPYVGNLFRTSVDRGKRRTELVILLTPYVVEDDFDAQAITESFRNQFSWAVAPEAPPLKKAPAPAAGAEAQAVTETESVGTAPENKVAENSPDAVPADGAKAATYRSSPYRLPPLDAPPLALPREPRSAPAPEPGWAPPTPSAAPAVKPASSTVPAAKPASSASGAAPVGKPVSSAAPAAKPVPDAAPDKPEGRPVTDEALRQELLEAVQRSRP